jgi:hypothetical protein
MMGGVGGEGETPSSTRLGGGSTLRQNQKTFGFATFKLDARVQVISQNLRNLRRWAIANSKINKLGWMTIE